MKKHIKFITLIILATFIVQISGLQDVYADCAYHSGIIAGNTEVSSESSNPDSGNANENANDAEKNDPVYLNSGEYNYSRQDLLIPGRGMPIEIIRSYKNQKACNGKFGYGWFMSYNVQLKRLSSGNIIIINGDSRKDEFLYDFQNDLYVPPAGVYSELVSNQDGTYTLTKKNKTRYNFDINGNCVRIIDRNNNQITFTYTETKAPLIGRSQYFVNQTEGVVGYDYQLTKITDTVGREINFTYNLDGRLEKISDFTGREIIYTYNEFNDLISVQDPEGNIIEYTYDTEHNLLTIEDAKDQIYLVNVYSNDKLISQTYGGNTPTNTYDEQNNQTTVLDRRGFTSIHTFDDDGNPIQVEELTNNVRPGDPISYISVFEYNVDKELIKKVFPRGNSIEYEYDDKGNLLKTTQKPVPGSLAADIITTFSYEQNYNFIKTHTDPKGNITTYYYDYEEASFGDLNADGIINEDKGNLVKISYPQVDGQTPEILYTYNTYGQIETMTNAAGIVTKYEYYSATGYLQRIINDFGDIPHLNATIEFTYDSCGNILTVTDAKSNTTTFEYDLLNRITRTISPAPFNYQTKYTYDENSNLIKLERQKDIAATQWQVTEYEYDVLDNLTQTKQHLSDTEILITQFEYDGNQNRTKIIDANLNETTFTYDEENRLYQVTDAENNVTEYAYDDNNNLREIKDAKNNITVYEYDDFDRLVKTIYPDTTYKEYTYDANSNMLTKLTRKGDLIQCAYDTLNRLDTKTYPDASAVNYAYDIASRLTSITDSNGVISYVYDALNRVTQCTNHDSRITGYEYDLVGNRTKLTYPDSSYITYEYDQLNRLTNIKDESAVNIVAYDYDPLSRRSQMDYANSVQTTYQYDDLNRLLSLTSSVQSISYTYDDVGNRLTKTDSSGVHNYTYDNIYQLVQAQDPSPKTTPE